MIEIKHELRGRELYLGILTIVIIIALCVAAIVYKDYITGVARVAGYSLLGMLVIAFLAGSTLSFVPVPVPYWLVLLTLPSVLAARWEILAPVIIGSTSALGCTLGHLPTFFIGYSGASLSRKVITINIPVYNRVVEWVKKQGFWAAFFISAIFNPFHVAMTLAIGALRCSPVKFFLFSLLGNMVKSLFLAFCGYFGLTPLLRLFGMLFRFFGM